MKPWEFSDVVIKDLNGLVLLGDSVYVLSDSQREETFDSKTSLRLPSLRRKNC